MDVDGVHDASHQAGWACGPCPGEAPLYECLTAPGAATPHPLTGRTNQCI
jgi:hypothetical protein